MNVIYFRPEFIDFFEITITSLNTTPVVAVTTPPSVNGNNNATKANNDREHSSTPVLE